MLTSIVSAVIILGLLILIHETGHFLVAKRCGVRVLRFSIGYPPKLFGVRRGETEYVIGGVPFGGYVRMLGDEIGDELSPADVATYLTEISQDLVGAADPQLKSEASFEERLLLIAQRLGGAEAQASTGTTPAALSLLGRELKPEEALLLDEIHHRGSMAEAVKSLSESAPPALKRRISERAFPSQPLHKRFAIVLAGPAANLIFAPLALVVVFMYGVPRLLPVLGQVKAGLPAAAAGLKPGDTVLSIDGQPIKTWDQLSTVVKRSDGSKIKIEYERPDGKSSTHGVAVIQPTYEEGKSGFGGTVHQWVIGVLPRGDSIVTRVGPMKAVEQAAVESVNMTGMLLSGMAKIVSGATPVREALGGPIMIARIAGEEAHAGFANVLLFTVTLSLELGIINLLPVPMLDGGHLAFFVIEGLRGKPLHVRHREIAQQVGLFLLVILMAFAIFNDISRIVQG